MPPVPSLVAGIFACFVSSTYFWDATVFAGDCCCSPVSVVFCFAGSAMAIFGAMNVAMMAADVKNTRVFIMFPSVKKTFLTNRLCANALFFWGFYGPRTAFSPTWFNKRLARFEKLRQGLFFIGRKPRKMADFCGFLIV